MCSHTQKCEGRGVGLYFDSTKDIEHLMSHDVILMSLESLHKISQMEPPDMIVFDELRSWPIGSTTLEQNHIHTAVVTIKTWYTKAKYVLCLDADMMADDFCKLCCCIASVPGALLGLPISPSQRYTVPTPCGWTEDRENQEGRVTNVKHRYGNPKKHQGRAATEETDRLGGVDEGPGRGEYKRKFVKTYQDLAWDEDTEIQVHHGQKRNDRCFGDLNTALKGKSLLIYTSVLAEGISVDTIPVQHIFMVIRFCRQQGGIFARTLAQMSMRCARSDAMSTNRDVLVLMES